MGGNVWHWNEQSVSSGSSRQFRGANWGTAANELAASYPISIDPQGGSSTASGFVSRVSSPSPGTGLLVMTGLLGLAVQRKCHAKAL